MTSISQTFTLEGVNCAGCVAKIERHVSAQNGVILARGNASLRRIRLVWDPASQTADALTNQIRALGYDAHPFQAGIPPKAEASLLPQLGLAGFGTMNIMAISFAVWGGVATDMGSGSMQFLHWISAALATPVIVYSAAVFYAPSLRAIRAGHITMDTPISIAIIVTYLASLIETVRGTEHVYFDAAAALVFFLLIGRVMERALIRRSGDAAENLRNFTRVEAHRERSDGTIETVMASDLMVDDIVQVETGARVPADCVLLSDAAQIDESVITGESVPRDVMATQTVAAGGIVFAGPARVQVVAVGDDAQIGKITQMIDAAVAHKGRTQKLADRFARSYIPLVLGGGLFGFALWYYVFDASVMDALMIAIAVLVVTCPCAAGLATPAVSARAVNILMRAGIVVKSGDALERLGEVDSIIADKTGTLSLPLPVLSQYDPEARLEAARLALGTAHPLAKELCKGLDIQPRTDLTDVAGKGIEASDGARLGSAEFVGIREVRDYPVLWYRNAAGKRFEFAFQEMPRNGVDDFLMRSEELRLPVSVLSGDSPTSVDRFADAHHIKSRRGLATPKDKLKALQAAIENGQKPLMFGDGINDAPALQAAYASASFASATEVAQMSADIVLMRPDPALLTKAVSLSRSARMLIVQNLWFSAAYNIVTVPLALAGILSPLIAACLMSSSSIIVLGNSLRLREPK